MLCKVRIGPAWTGGDALAAGARGQRMQGAAQHFIFDDRGQVWEADSLELRQSLYFPAHEPNFALQVVKNLGFIAAERRRQNAIITFRPRTVSPVAFASLLYWLSDEPPDRICLAILSQQLSHEVHGSLKQVVDRMARLIEQQQGEQPLFTARGLSATALSEGSPFRWLLTTWERSNKRLCWSSFSKEVDRRFDGRFVALQPGEEISELVIERVGTGLRIPDYKWRASARGTRLADLPDRSYGRWVSNAYLYVLRTGRPRFDDVSAKIYWPQSGRLHCEYRRLILPWIDADGRPLLLSASGLQRRLSSSVEAA
jgi:hypothetical protein